MSDVAGHAVLLLAAGQSLRLGQSKQLLRKNSVTLIRHMAQLGLATQPATMIVVVAPEPFSQQPPHNQLSDNKLSDTKPSRDKPLKESIAAQLEDLPLRVVINNQASTGMASSLQAGAKALQDHQQAVLILAVDQPLLTAEHLNQLLMQYQTNATLAVASAYADTLGLPAVVSAELFKRSHLLSGDYGLKRLFMQQAESLGSVKAQALAFDIDTPDALQHAREQGWID